MSFLAVLYKKARFLSPRYLAIFLVLFCSKIFRLNGLRACRFHPSCSQYSVQAFERFDFLKASVWTLRRLLRCHPFVSGGYDPLPTRPEKI